MSEYYQILWSYTYNPGQIIYQDEYTWGYGLLVGSSYKIDSDHYEYGIKQVEIQPWPQFDVDEPPEDTEEYYHIYAGYGHYSHGWPSFTSHGYNVIWNFFNLEYKIGANWYSGITTGKSKYFPMQGEVPAESFSGLSSTQILGTGFTKIRLTLDAHSDLYDYNVDGIFVQTDWIKLEMRRVWYNPPPSKSFFFYIPQKRNF